MHYKYVFLLLLLLGYKSNYGQQHLLPVKGVIKDVDFSFKKEVVQNKWKVLDQGCYFKAKKGNLNIDCSSGKRYILLATPFYFNPKENYTIEFKVKVPFVGDNGRGFEISVYDGIKAFDLNVTAKQITDYSIKKILVDSVDFSSKLRTVRFAVERFVGIVHVYIDGEFFKSYLMRKSTKEKYIKIGKIKTDFAAEIDLSSFYIDFTGAYRPK